MALGVLTTPLTALATVVMLANMKATLITDEYPYRFSTFDQLIEDFIREVDKRRTR